MENLKSVDFDLKAPGRHQMPFKEAVKISAVPHVFSPSHRIAANFVLERARTLSSTNEMADYIRELGFDPDGRDPSLAPSDELATMDLSTKLERAINIYSEWLAMRNWWYSYDASKTEATLLDQFAMAIIPNMVRADECGNHYVTDNDVVECYQGAVQMICEREKYIANIRE